MIALLCAVDIEAGILFERIRSSSSSTMASKTIIEGELGGRKVVICAGGMGKVNAAHASALLILRARPEAVIVFGIGGAYASSGAAIGDIAVAEKEIAGDEGVLTPEGFKDTEYIGIPLLKTSSSALYNTYPAPEPLLRRSLQALNAASPAGEVRVGPFVTLSTSTGTEERARELEHRYHALCENMEGAAAAHVATSHGVPWLEVRGISNIVEERNVVKWDIPKAARAAQHAVTRILESWTA